GPPGTRSPASPWGRAPDREESTAENRQLLEQELAPIIRALMISALMIGAQQCHPQVPPTCAQQCAY
ncbi:unnamed protein product, partial [Staurois parvus]